jgi:hypothetical protein
MKMIQHTFSQNLDEMDANFEILVKQNEEAKKQGVLVGRFIQTPYADGYAYYVITEVTKTRAKLHVATGIGDDWTPWGITGYISLRKAESLLNYQDRLARLFGGEV